MTTPLPTTPSPSPPSSSGSPAWSNTIKTIVGVAILVVVAFLVARFRFILGPLIMAFILAYLLHPIAANVSRITHLPWKTSVKVIFIVVAVILLGLIAWLGFAIVQQVRNLFTIIQEFIQGTGKTGGLPELVKTISTEPIIIGPFSFDLSQLNLENLLNQILPNLQAPLTRVGNLITSLAGGTLVVLAWIFFILIIAFFLLNETSTVSDALVPIDIPGYHEDMRLLGQELRKIWNAFLRGQLSVVFLVILIDTIVFLIFGMRAALGLALLAGLGRFIPYLGVWGVCLVIYLTGSSQESNYFGLPPWLYAIMVIIVFIVIDQIFDQFVVPRVMGDTLGVHPAALLVAAIVAANLLGIVGLMLAAPVLATFLLVGRYVMRKMFDLDPFPIPHRQRKKSSRFTRLLEVYWHRLRERLRKFTRS